ncbi:hypothetical protein U472_13115 [Orenia metallireducens]|uniref:Protein kinase domain-containing protein n=1 Tax=Orenia metallireducens TaxID=1413210 RepID=A0A1C0A579_9FIRM|nr:serine/threonine-protein kinase [Orenia metallireducens]OCL25292.1 hypothetical protein U472_13115 [Orenia metallireducens]
MKNNNEIDYIYLPKESILNNKYIIKRRLAERSNFSIVYMAENIENNEKVVIKEFFPKNLVLRDLDGKTIICKNSFMKESLQEKMNEFLNEAKLMKSLEDEFIAKCYEFFIENNTAYIVTKYYDGVTLDYYLEEEKDFEQFLKKIFFPLLNTVEQIHGKQYIHRDIKPSNIIIHQNRPILIDFGSAINYKSNDKKNIFLTPGFSPIEFYSEKSKQGPYSDIYSLSALLYYFFTTNIPEESLNRIIEDNLKSIDSLNQEIPDKLNNIIMKNLSLDYKRRDRVIAIFKLKLWGVYLNYKFKKLISNLFNRFGQNMSG